MSDVDKKDNAASHDDWQADWEGHRQWQLTATLETTPAQRLAWLEEVLELMRRIATQPGGDSRGSVVPQSTTPQTHAAP